MVKNIVMCFDGTGGEVRARRNSNVVLLYSMLDLSDPSQQVAYYDPGVGTEAAAGAWSPPGRAFSKLLGLAFGVGIRRNLGQAYLWLADHWEPEDRIYLFGFSRGAYTARALAGMLRTVGLVRPGSENLVNYMVAGYTRRQPDDRDEVERAAFWGDAHRLSAVFARPVDDRGRTTPPIHYLGLWDTVKSVGLLTWSVHWRYTNKLPMVDRVRHALSIHEWRRPFLHDPVKAGQAKPALEEVWFAGVHTDVGGGFDDDRLSRIAFKWVVDGAIDSGIRIRFEGTKVRPGYDQLCRLEPPDADGAVNRLSGWWRLLGVSRRRVPPTATVHSSVRARIEGGAADVPPLSASVTWSDPDWLTPRSVTVPES
jgi:uncharacterized protein (DUF2235 family)